jgi:hypothetical protein
LQSDLDLPLFHYQKEGAATYELVDRAIGTGRLAPPIRAAVNGQQKTALIRRGSCAYRFGLPYPYLPMADANHHTRTALDVNGQNMALTQICLRRERVDFKQGNILITSVNANCYLIDTGQCNTFA